MPTGGPLDRHQSGISTQQGSTTDSTLLVQVDSIQWRIHDFTHLVLDHGRVAEDLGQQRFS